jgi:3'-phosphoadenosine 5'-phosphosulfate sulfotransferase (PAPS reductase)/FAD synthetase
MALEELIARSHQIIDEAVSTLILDQDRTLAATAVLFSGGQDSTVLAHLMKERANLAVHLNTGVGIEQTRKFVRDTCAAWSLPLREYHPPLSYRALVVEQGFPGPAHHWKMYTRLKERCLEQARNDLVGNPRRQRVLFLAGRRRSESVRRAQVPAYERWPKTSVVWASPLVDWSSTDLEAYRQAAGDVPRNEVSDMLHMSGECLCGAFAKPHELEEIGFWFPGMRAEIEALELEVIAAGNAPAWRCRWGWGADKDVIARLRRQGWDDERIATQFTRSPVGPLCTNCEAR